MNDRMVTTVGCPEQFREVLYQKNQGQYRLTFLKKSILQGNSVWCYEVEVAFDPALSFWILGLCIDPQHQILRVTLDGKDLIEEIDYELKLITPDPLTQIFGIKFLVPIEKEDPPMEFCIRLAGDFQIEPVDVGVKAGAPPALTGKKICGPACSKVSFLQRGLEIL